MFCRRSFEAFLSHHCQPKETIGHKGLCSTLQPYPPSQFVLTDPLDGRHIGGQRVGKENRMAALQYTVLSFGCQTIEPRAHCKISLDSRGGTHRHDSQEWRLCGSWRTELSAMLGDWVEVAAEKAEFFGVPTTQLPQKRVGLSIHLYCSTTYGGLTLRNYKRSAMKTGIIFIFISSSLFPGGF